MGYREDILKVVAVDRSHPVHHGVKMQAHHLVSKQGLKLSGIANELEHLGYNVNKVLNIALVPCTLQGACHLDVQVHRGNHPVAKIIPITEGIGDNDDDNNHPEPYHREISKRVEKIKKDIEGGDYCSKQKSDELLDRMDELSEKIAEYINNRKLALTVISHHFGEGDRSIGCCDSDAVQQAKRNASEGMICSSNRNHFKGRKSSTQKAEEIKIKKSDTYKVRGGN